MSQIRLSYESITGHKVNESLDHKGLFIIDCPGGKFFSIYATREAMIKRYSKKENDGKDKSTG